MNALLEKDHELLLFLNSLGSATFDPFWLMITGKWFWIPFYIILLYLVYKSFPLKKLIFILIFIVIGITISDQLAGIFKVGVARLRPCHNELLMAKMRLVTCGGQYGFYSSHASNCFFIAGFLSMLLAGKYRFLPYILFFWAALVSYSRIYLGVHFPLDVAFGANVGFLLSGVFANLARRIIYKN